MRLKLTIAYDGRPYRGWATQPSSDTVQDLIEKAIEKITSQRIRIYGSGRTDTGVHARGQVAHFDAPESISMNPYNWVPAINTKLPPSIRIMECSQVPEDFHARYLAKEKTYCYELNFSPILPPLKSGLVWHLPAQLDKELLAEALALFKGKHSFRAFAALRGNENENTDFTRILTECRMVEIASGCLLFFKGNGFLYKMVRLITGSVVCVAQGKFSIDSLDLLLDQADDLPHGRAPFCAPPDGLTLENVRY